MRRQSKLKVQPTKEELTTSDPTMIHQPTNDAEEAPKEVLHNVSLTFGKMRKQLMTLQ